MVWMRAKETCHGRNGLTRFGFLSSTLYFSYNVHKMLHVSDIGVLNQIGLKGEALQLHSLSGSSSVEWGSLIDQKQPLTWYKVRNMAIIYFLICYFIKASCLKSTKTGSRHRCITHLNPKSVGNFLII